MLPAISSLISALPEFTPERPARILFSACLGGEPCGVDGTSYGAHEWIQKVIALPNVKGVPFCPEHFSFGTPRRIPDIHGGDGFDVLDGKARVLSDAGEDMTEGMIAAARRMLELARHHQVDLAILMDLSAACGSSYISDGCRLAQFRGYRQGPGVCAALLMRNGVTVIGQRDHRTLEELHRKLDPAHVVDTDRVDWRETPWYLAHFKGTWRESRPAERPNAVQVATHGALEIEISRACRASRRELFAALTDPALLPAWQSGPAGWSIAACESDLRPGGRYRLAWKHADGRATGTTLEGEYLEIVGAERLVRSERFDPPWFTGAAVREMELVERADGTLLRCTLRFESREARDHVLRSPFKEELELAYERLEAQVSGTMK